MTMTRLVGRCPLFISLLWRRAITGVARQEAEPTLMGWNVADASSVYRPTCPDRYGSWLSVKRTRRRPFTSTSMLAPRCWILTVYHRPGGKTGWLAVARKRWSPG